MNTTWKTFLSGLAVATVGTIGFVACTIETTNDPNYDAGSILQDTGTDEDDAGDSAVNACDVSNVDPEFALSSCIANTCCTQVQTCLAKVPSGTDQADTCNGFFRGVQLCIQQGAQNDAGTAGVQSCINDLKAGYTDATGQQIVAQWQALDDCIATSACTE